MDYVNLGATGLKVSRICLGCMTYGSSKWRGWILGEEESQPFFRQAVEGGINFFDTADVPGRATATCWRQKCFFRQVMRQTRVACLASTSCTPSMPA
jgi:aryl-alcohol dehydrogenase-like predicted oxidoreductase